MFVGNCAIILGAGASVDFGLPTGNEIFDETLGKLRQFEQLLEGTGPRWISRVHPVRGGSGFNASEVAFLVNCLAEKEAEQSSPRPVNEKFTELMASIARRFLDLRHRLETSTAETIDEFITLNPSLSGICKLLIVSILFKRLYNFSEDAQLFSLKSFNQRMLHGRSSGENTRNWIHLFINAYRTNLLRGRQKIPEDKISIVTFNYDPILRLCLDSMFSSCEPKIGSWDEHFRLLPVYGEFRDPPKEVRDVFPVLDGWSASITTVPSRRSAAPEPVSHSIAQFISNADTVYAAGFAFARDNCEYIGLPRRYGRPIWYANWDANPGLDDRVIRYTPLESQKAFRADARGYMSMARAIGLGLLGELPA